MSTSDVPKFACASCGRLFRWKRELAGKKAKCVCGAVVPVPANEPIDLEPERGPVMPTPVESAFTPTPEPEEDNPFAIFSKKKPAVEPPAPPPPPPASSTDTPASTMPAWLTEAPSSEKPCPVCNTAVPKTAILCSACGYNFATGLRTIGFGRKPDPREATGGGSIAADTYQLAAKASWVAPLVALGLGCCVAGAFAKQATMLGGAFAITQLLLLVAGLGLGVFALSGIKRNGKEGILVPAAIGMSLCGVIVALGIVGAILESRQKDEQAGASAKSGQGKTVGTARTSAEGEHVGMASLVEPGWVGTDDSQGAAVTLIGISDDSPLSALLLDNLDTPVSMALLRIDNTKGTTAVKVDPIGGRVFFKDGTSKPLPEPLSIVRRASRGRADVVQMFAPPFETAPGGQLAGKVVFLPPETPMRQIDSISLRIDGTPTKVKGRFMSGQEKLAAITGSGETK